MADIHDKRTRSYNMSRIKGKNTKPEIEVRRFLHSQGFRYRIHSFKLPGKPDIVLSKYRTVVFVNGCFWHGHKNCRYFRLPASETQKWKKKIQKTKHRDFEKEQELYSMGWNVITVWECELRPGKKVITLQSLFDRIKNNEIH